MARFNRSAEREKRHRRIRKRIHGTSARPRLCINKTVHHLSAQVIDDDRGLTLASVSTQEKEIRGQVTGPNIPAAQKVGEILAGRALEAGIRAVVFDRGGHPYHGVISAFAEACRKGGLDF